MSGNLIIDKEAFASQFPRQPFKVRHNFADHPLLKIERLLKLQEQIPKRKIDWYTGEVGVNTDRLKTEPTGLSPEETIGQIRDCKSWLVLKNVEAVPEYRELLENAFAPYRSTIESLTPGMRQLEAWVFITSPGSIAPYHIDPEHNFLLQVHGPKIVHVFDPKDPEIVTDKEIEDYYYLGGTNAKLEYREKYQEKVKKFVLQPGEGVHIPFVAPHWVEVEDDYSISFSVSFYSKVCDNVGRLYRFNAMLRRAGITPSTPGKSPMRDAVKTGAISTLLKARNMWRGKTAGNRGY